MTFLRTMKSIQDKTFPTVVLARLVLASVLFAGMAFALPHTLSGQDSVYKLRDDGRSSKVNGRITAVTANGVTINGAEVPAALVQKVTYGKEPLEVGRARDQMESGQFGDAIEELKKIKTNVDANVKQEIDFIRAYSTAQISLRGGGVTPKNAAGAVKSFIDSNSNSFHLVPAKDQFARLAFAAGLPEVAEAEFKKLQATSWLEYKLKGYFHAGQMQIQLGKLEAAEASFGAIAGVESNDNMSQTYKLLAACELAKISGLRGNTESAQKQIEEIIKKENSDNKKLFAHLYNALGAVHEKAGQLKQAARAYLHTELLFASETEAHAEAVYRLALIWPKLEDTDRANRARNMLKERYRNSFWASKL